MHKKSGSFYIYIIYAYIQSLKIVDKYNYIWTKQNKLFNFLGHLLQTLNFYYKYVLKLIF